MKRILKYKLPRDGEVITIEANIVKWLNIQEQNGWPMIWAVVEDEGYESEYEIVAWGTGWDFPDELNHCRYMGTAQDGAGYVWHYFMQEKSKSWSPADSAIATAPLQGVDYWNEWLKTTPAVVQDYSVTISCGDADSAVSALSSSNAATTVTIDALADKISNMLVTGSVAELHSCAHA